MMNLLPELDFKLRSKPFLHAGICNTLKTFEELTRVSRIVFFPDFTDHGATHIQNVINTCVTLLNPESIELINTEDACVIVLSGLLHDIGMHLTADAFRTLIRQDRKPESLIDTLSWQDLWANFRTEVSKFTPSDNIRLFGRPERVAIPDMNERDWTESQFRLIGEFIRRHHGRLAHEIALFGFPAATDRAPVFIDNSLTPLANIAGLVARSHSMHLRECVDQLERQYQNRVSPLNVHVVLCMAVLRVADYLQIESERAPALRLRIQSVLSPISKLEWAKHAAVLAVEDHPNDPECKFVRVGPMSDVRVYLGLQRLLSDIQSELDESWAVLGEVYGLQRRGRLNEFGLSIRRLHSNLTDPIFCSKLPFLPVQARFRVSEALLPELVGPLYGYQAEIGIRELVQNAVDAVNEVRIWNQGRGNEGGLSLRANSADVEITLHTTPDAKRILTILDRGIGMTVDTLRDYFLTAGASYRQSESWRGEFWTNEVVQRLSGLGASELVLLRVFFWALK